MKRYLNGEGREWLRVFEIIFCHSWVVNPVILNEKFKGILSYSSILAIIFFFSEAHSL